MGVEAGAGRRNRDRRVPLRRVLLGTGDRRQPASCPPYFGSSLFVWGALISCPRRALGRVLARRNARRPLHHAVSADRVDCGGGAVLVLLVPIVDGWVLEQIVGRIGPRLDPLVRDRPLRRHGVVLGGVSPIAVRW